MDMFLYLDKDTFLHRLDPRTKMLVMLASFVVALMFYSFQLLLVLGIVIILYGYSGKILSNLVRIKFILIMIGLFSVVLWSFSKGGSTVLFGPFTWEGIVYGLIIGMKFDIMIISGMVFLSSTKIEEISLGL